MAILDFQVWLDEVGDTLFNVDFETYCAHVSVPFTLITQSATMTISDQEGLRRGFDAYIEMFKAQHITHMVRKSSGVIELGPDILCGNYETHLLRNAIRVVPPFSSSMVLRREEGIWRAASITNSWTNTQWPVALPRVNETGSDTATRPHGNDPGKYQNIGPLL